MRPEYGKRIMRDFWSKKIDFHLHMHVSAMLNEPDFQARKPYKESLGCKEQFGHNDLNINLLVPTHIALPS